MSHALRTLTLFSTQLSTYDEGEDNGYEEDDDDVVGEYNMPRITTCISLILESVSVLMKSKRLTSTKGGRSMLHLLLNQLAHGERNGKNSTPGSGGAAAAAASSAATPAIFLKGLKCLFDMIEESCKTEKYNLTFAMTGVSTLEAVIGCAERVVASLDTTLKSKSGSGTGKLTSAQKKERLTIDAMNKQLSALCYTFMQRDWCPANLRETRHKFHYSKENVSVLVACYMQCSCSSVSVFDSMSASEIKDCDVAEIGRIGGERKH